MSAELIAKLGALTEHQKMLIAQGITSADRATEILDQLLDLTRARLGSGLHILQEEMDMAFASRQMLGHIFSLRQTLS
jgi:hypothetical protein